MRDEIQTVLRRVEGVDPDEVEGTRAELERYLEEWRNLKPPSYGRMGGTVSEVTLAYPAGGRPDEVFQGRSWPVLTSMRNVDGTCMANVVLTYDGPKQDTE